MSRYFLEVAYKGDHYSGFQIQENAATIQSEIEKAFAILQRTPVNLTGSSRTDAGVHAFQNFFHFDFGESIHAQFGYKMNAILPKDIAVKALYSMHPDAHCRFDAVSRQYIYRVHQFKNPFLNNTSLYYPYKLNVDEMKKATEFLKHQQNFFAFAKTNTQVSNFLCTILEAQWEKKNQEFVFTIEANRFLRGMVRLITATILKVGRGILSFQEFQNLFIENQKCGHSVPARGLYLHKVNYKENYFAASALHFSSI